ncbi:MAG: RsmB/NOP family class I SAM-dependent RNA methyltransferase [Verrucomicrobiota bacterium]
MISDIFQVAAEVISRANREKPADQVLRETFKRFRDLPSFDATEISRLVFTYFRWQGWLVDERSMDARLRRAREFADRFAKTPLAFPGENLRAKAVPAWALDAIPVSDEWLRTLQHEPKLWLRARRGQGKALLKKLGDCRSFNEAMPETLEYCGEKDLFRTPQFHAGEFEVQDVSSQAVGFICQPKPGETWWDTCAGEGGKLLHLSDLMENKGLIWASDRASWRLQKLKRRAGRAGVFNYRSVLWDGGAKLPTKTKFDGVLVDAPCSGVGTWQRNPHARWTTTPQDVSELSAIQKNLLKHAATAVKPGGNLIYSVCTLTNAETTQVADDFEAHFTDFKPLPVINPAAPEQSASTRHWLWPQNSGGNGMFIAAWQKTPAA